MRKFVMVILGLTLASWAGLAGEAASEAAQLLELSKIRGGVCAHLDCGDASLTADLARSGRFLVEGLCADAASIPATREKLFNKGLAGLVHVSLLDPQRLPFVDNLVNLLVMENAQDRLAKGLTPKELLRVMAPLGAACLSVEQAQVEDLKTAFSSAGIKDFRFEAVGRGWLVLRKPWPEGMDGWSHARHGADGNPVSGDLTIEAPNRMQWITGPSWGNGRYDKGPASATPHAVLSAGGRNFYFAGGRIVARDSFNGVLLWTRKTGKAGSNQAVAGEHAFYLCEEDRILGLDAATGQELRTYATGVKCAQLLLEGGVLYAVAHDGVRAYDSESGKEQWTSELGAGKVVAEGGKLYLATRGNSIACVNAGDGKTVWNKDLGGKAQILFVAQGMLVLQTPGPNGLSFMVHSGADGAHAWSFESNKNDALSYHAAGLVWMESGTQTPGDGMPAPKIGSEVISAWTGHEPKTGEVRRKLTGQTNNKYRCHTLYATQRFVIDNRPLYFTDWMTGASFAFEGTRAQCGSAYSLGNGLLYGLYTDSKKCMCMSTAISGVTAFGNDGGKTHTGEFAEEEGRLEKGDVAPPESSKIDQDDWPMYRGDALRSSCSPGRLSGALEMGWRTKLIETVVENEVTLDWKVNKPAADSITPPVVAGGIVYVGLTHAGKVVALDEASGKEVWSFHVGGRLDAPPSIHKGMCLVGSHDGWVYGLRADSGKLVWRFRAAPAEKRMSAYGQLESPWPIVGGVLISGDRAFVLAGRSTETDGGLYVHALDPLSGQSVWSGRRYKEDPKPFGGYTPRRGTTYVGAADLLCSDGSTVSIAGCARGRFSTQTGNDLTYTKGGPVLGWVPTRYYTDQYGTQNIPVAYIGKFSVNYEGKTKSIRAYSKNGWSTPTNGMLVEALAGAAGRIVAQESGVRMERHPAARVAAAAAPPVIDGAIDEAFLKQTPLTFSHLDGTLGQPKEATRAWLLVDAENLYLAFRCEKADPEKVICTKTQRDDDVWMDECVEIFLDPTHTRKNGYFHLIVNPAGVTQESKEKDLSWNPALTVACGKEAGKAWTAEIAIPLKDLGPLSHLWSLNLNRSARAPNDPSKCEDTAWSPTFTESSHEPGMFGYLWLDALAKDGQDFAAFEKDLKPFKVQKPEDQLPKVDVDAACVVAAMNPNRENGGGEVWVLAAGDGKVVQKVKLDAPPAFDGLAIAGGKVFVTLQDGSVVCLKAP